MEKPSYLLIADDSIGLSLDNNKKMSLKAHLKHTLLFEEQILLSDAQIIGNKNFRMLFAEDDEFREIFNKQNFIIALRDCIDFRTKIKNQIPVTIDNPSLDEVLDGFVSWDKCNWGKSERLKNRYAQKRDLEMLSLKAKVKRYNFLDINHKYSSDVVHTFLSKNVRQILGDKLSETIYKLAEEKRESSISDFNSKGGVGIAYFKQELGEELKNLQLEKEWKKYKRQIIEIAQAPYLTALPKVLYANPIYGAMHKQSIELLKGNIATSRQIGEVRNFESRLLRFEEGINALSANSIMKLRESKAFKEFRKKISTHNGTETSLNDVLLSLEEYKNRIDDEILLCFPFLREPKKIKREILKPINFIYESPNYVGLILGGMAVATLSFPGMNEVSLGLGALSLYTSKMLEKKKKELENKKELEKKKLSDLLSSNEVQNKIEFEHLLNNKTDFFEEEIFYSSVSK